MENFFVDDQFYGDVEDFVEAAEWDEEIVRALPDDWKQEVMLTRQEKVFSTDLEYIASEMAELLCDRNDDRMPEDPWQVIEKVKAAIRGAIDIDKLRELMPSLYYPADEKATLTKADIIACLYQ